MTPSLYDLLDVDETATPEEIRAAWRAAIADREPSDRRFRAFNDAAAVLLDPARRAEYDDRLAAERDAAEAAAREDPAPRDPTPERSSGSPAVGEPDRSEGEPVPAPDDVAEQSDPATPATAHDESAPRPGRATAGRGAPSTGTLVGVGLAALISGALLVWLLTLPGTTGVTPQERREEAAAVSETAASAEEAASRAVRPVLSYDYRTLDENVAEATALMTDTYAEQHRRLFAELRKEARAQRIVVSASVSGTAVSRVSEDGDVAQVVVFVDQDVRKAGAEPVVLRMWATATLVREDETWLLDDLCTEGDCT